MSLLGIALAGLVACASWAATQLVETNGAFALAAHRGHVALSVGDQVLLTDDDGALIGIASDDAGQPWRFGEVASVSFDDTGRLYATDLERREVVRFDARARGGERLPLGEPPRFTFEVLVDGDLRVVADTMGHHVQTLRADGTVESSRRVVYPNGLTRTLIGGVPALVFAETGHRAARAWSLALEPLDWPAITKLNGDLERRTPRDLLELTVTPQGSLLAADCRDPAGECTILRVDSLAERVERVADVVPFVAPDPDAVEGLLGVGELAATSKGSVLVASPRLGAVLEFSNDAAGAPSGGFCEACDAAEYGPPIDVRSLAAPLTWKNGTRIRRFGDAAVQARVEAIWAARHTYSRLERNAQAGAWLVATALLLALFLSRQARGADSQTKVQRVVAQLLRPQLPVLLVLMLPVALAFAGGLVLGQQLLGAAGGAAVGVALGVLAARLLVPRLYVPLQHPEAGARAFNLFLRVHLDEPVHWARFVRPERSVVKQVVASAEASQFDDLLDALEALAPRLTLLIKTEHRLLSVPTSLLGAPQGPFVELDAADVPLTNEGVGRLVVHAPGASRVWWLGAGATVEVKASSVTVRCEQCGQRAGSCEHTEVELAVPVLASLIFPGLGALLHGGRVGHGGVVAAGTSAHRLGFTERQSMTRSQQVGLLGALLVSIVVLGGWRTWRAVQEARQGPSGRNQTHAEWERHLKIVSIDREVPEGFQPLDHPSAHCAGLPAIPLAKLRWRDLMPRFDGFDQVDARLPFPIHNKASELRGNCVLKGSIDDRGEELEPGEGWLELTVALVHTGKVPFSRLPRRHQPFCMITDVTPGGEGDRAGLVAGDVVVGAGAFDLSKQTIEGDVCAALVSAMEAFKPKEPYSMAVVKGGALIQIPRTGGVMFGIRFLQVPVLDADLAP